MAESSLLVVPETNIMALKEALCAQQQLLRQLYNELDVEREASATAASEALSMILRLQGEKASLKMEASQYKRMTEEKMCHVEKALELSEDLMYQKEMEITSLEFQVQVYRYRLLSMGCNDLGVSENIFPENLLIQRNDTLLEEKVVNSNIRQLNSPPAFSVKDSNLKKTTVERKRHVIPVPGLGSGIEDESESQRNDESERKSGSFAVVGINSYWQQIKRLDERVKEISDGKDSGRCKSTFCKGGTCSPSLFSQTSIGTILDSAGDINSRTADPVQVKHLENSREREVIVDAACPSSAQDIFEVQKICKSYKFSEPQKKECTKWTVEGERKLRKPYASENTLELTKEKETDQVKTMLHSINHERELPKPRDGFSAGCNHGDSQPDRQQLTQRIEHLERARNNGGQEITAGGEEELKLLEEMSEQLKLIESGVRSLTAKKSTPVESLSLDPLHEAMIYFWL
uniref:GTD-binding domain-containing protein n=1 Tax=Rhizophora mucronata TaxID=61149 RepID=A0A2P2ILK6_RHIMU